MLILRVYIDLITLEVKIFGFIIHISKFYSPISYFSIYAQSLESQICFVPKLRGYKYFNCFKKIKIQRSAPSFD